MTSANPEEQAQTLVEHLTELRVRLLRALYGVVLAFGGCYYFSEQLMTVIRKPIQPFLPEGGLVFLSVMDKFLSHLKVSLLAAVIVSCPWWFYQAWKFISPGLYENERRYATYFIASGSVLFVAGAAFAYFWVFPAAFEFLLKFGGEVDRPMITLSDYLSFFVTSTLVFGAAFELPLILVVLGIFGIVDDQLLRSKRRYAIVILAAVSAVLTPPDALSMFMLLVPMMLLYELSIILVKMLKRKPQQTEGPWPL